MPKKRSEVERRQKLIKQMEAKDRTHRGGEFEGASSPAARLGVALTSVMGAKRPKTGGFVPELAGTPYREEDREWQRQAPHLTPDQQKRLAELTLRAGQRAAGEVTPGTFLDVHRRLERELSESVREDKTLKGLVLALEWRCWFSEEGRHFYGTTDRFFDVSASEVGHFADSAVIHAVEVFQPRGVPMQHERKEDFLESAEEAIHYRQKRAEAGDGYYSPADMALGDVPTGLNDAPVDVPRED